MTFGTVLQEIGLLVAIFATLCTGAWFISRPLLVAFVAGQVKSQLAEQRAQLVEHVDMHVRLSLAPVQVEMAGVTADVRNLVAQRSD